MSQRTPRGEPRRGVLMLVVVSMLTLFLMLGTTYLVVATRAKQAARAQARLAVELNVVKPASLLDAVLLKVVRGGPGGISGPLLGGTTIDFESLLSDRYGPSVTGTVSGLAIVAGAPLISGTLTSGTTAGLEAASDLPGRVITLLGPGREPTSHRILRATATGAANISAEVVLDNPPRRRVFTLSGTVPAVVNGLDFDGSSGNEQYDAFDAANPFLAHVQPADVFTPASPQLVAQSIPYRASYVPSLTGTAARDLLDSSSNGLTRGADNDNDGSRDGFFLNFGLPSMPAANGSGSIQFDASVLVVDLDSRFNVNAHGSLMPSVYPRGCVGWPQPQGGETIPTVANAPLGSGYGPAEVNASWMFPRSSYPLEASRRMRGAADNQNSDVDANDTNDALPPSAVQPAPFLLSGAAVATQGLQRRPGTSRFSAGTPLPNIGDIEGRYGEGSLNRVVSSAAALATSATNSNSFQPLNSLLFPLARPGVPRQNDKLSAVRDATLPLSVDNSISFPADPWWNGTPSFNWATNGGTLRSVYNSPPDLHGRLLTTTATSAAIVPRLMYAAPEWGNEATDDPYEVRLDPRTARNSVPVSAGDSWDNIYGYSELEGLLRQYDRDGQQLPKRLLNVLGPAGEEARLRVTTDSWDTTMVTGTAAQKIRQFLRSGTGTIIGTNPVTGLINNESARGERLNLNRPLTSSKPAAYDAAHPYFAQRQSLFKDLFTLVIVTCGATNAADKAQWAANVVEFQDADSTMTPFEYDTLCGTSPHEWTVDGDVTTETAGEIGRRAVVWGAERPEVVIRDALAWPKSPDSSGGIALTLHRPWNATAISRVSGTNYYVAGEPCDYQLDTLAGGSPTNVVDLGKKPGGAYHDVSPETLPIWRVRISSGGVNQFVRLDSGSSAPGQTHIISPELTDGVAKPKLGADASLTILSGTTVVVGTTPTTGTATINTGTTTAVLVPNIPINSAGTVTAYLERLSDLTFPLTLSGSVPGTLLSGVVLSGSDVWTADASTLGSASNTKAAVRYITVDQCEIMVKPPVELQITPSIRSGSSVSQAFWAPPSPGSTLTVNGSAITLPFSISGSSAAWFVWPNRPLISAAELFLVPKGSAGGMLANYGKPTATDNDLLALTGTNTRLLLDAVHVPTRFAGIHTTINATGTTTLASNGIFAAVAPVNQMSSFREPGRVNLNTVTSDDVWNAVVAGPLQLSGSAKPLVVSGTAGANFAANPAKSMLDILALSSSGTAPRGDNYAGNPAMAEAKSRNPLHEFYTATRLANTATTRSNVFAIWITVRETVDGDPDTVKLHRGFYIVDRSIPVAYEPGKDHNVWDCVVLRRIIE